MLLNPNFRYFEHIFNPLMSQNGQTHFKNLVANAARIFKVCLAILGHYALKG